MTSERDLRYELEIPKLEDNGLVLDHQLPYSLWENLNDYAKANGYITAFIPEGYDVYLLKKNEWLGKWQYYEVKKWTEQRDEMRAYYENMRRENEFLKNRLMELEDGI